MLKYILISFSFLILPFSTFCQVDTLQPNQNKNAIIIGIELGDSFNFKNYGVGPHITLGLNIGYRWNKLTFLTGIHTVNRKEYNSALYTGVEIIDPINQSVFYEHERKTYDLKYYSIPLTIEYETPLSFILLSGSAHYDILRSEPNGSETVNIENYEEILNDVTQHPTLKENNLSFIAGIGLQMYFWKNKIKLLPKFEYEYLSLPFNEADRVDYKTSKMRLSLHLRYAFLH